MLLCHRGLPSTGATPRQRKTPAQAALMERSGSLGPTLHPGSHRVMWTSQRQYSPAQVLPDGGAALTVAGLAHAQQVAQPPNPLHSWVLVSPPLAFRPQQPSLFPTLQRPTGSDLPSRVGAGALDGGGGFSLPLGDVGGCHGGDRRHAQPSPLRASSAPLACKIPPASPWVGGAHAAAVACCCTLHRAACTGETAELSGSEYPAAAGLLGHAGAGHAAAAAAMPDKACYSYSLESSRSVPVQLLTGGSHSSGAACHLGNPSQHYLPCHAYTAGCPEHLPGTMMATKAFDAEARMVSRRLQS